MIRVRETGTKMCGLGQIILVVIKRGGKGQEDIHQRKIKQKHKKEQRKVDRQEVRKYNEVNK
jgi:hypothetical protein